MAKTIRYFIDNDGDGHTYKGESYEAWMLKKAEEEGWREVTRKEYEASDREQARRQLLKMLKPGAKVYTILARRSSSGMSRSIKLAIPGKDHNGKPAIIDISWIVARLLGYTFDRDNGGVKVSGAGMDMGFHVVYALGSRMWPNGTPKPHSTRNGEPDKAGGYALKHEWL